MHEYYFMVESKKLQLRRQHAAKKATETPELSVSKPCQRIKHSSVLLRNTIF
jgi:hypothetical protein